MKKFFALSLTGLFLFTVAAEAKTYTGYASFYKMGRRTANGERFKPNGLTAAHRSLAFGTRIKVTNLANGKSVVVRINDRGPFGGRRIIDLSYGAAKAVGLVRAGVGKVKFVVIEPAGKKLPERGTEGQEIANSLY